MRLQDAYHQKADAQLREWQVWIEQIKAGGSLNDHPTVRSSEGLRAVNRLDDCYHIAQVRLDELRSASEECWEKAKRDLEQALIDLKQALDVFGGGSVGRSVPLQADRSRVFEPFYHRRG